MIEKYGINITDIYNIDKIGFQIRVIIGYVIIIYLLIKVVYLIDPNNRESLTTVETISTNSFITPLILILKGDVLLEKYFENDLENNTLLITFPSSYLNEGLVIKYLIHFHNNTWKKYNNLWCILIFDSNRSHVSDNFLLYY